MYHPLHNALDLFRRANVDIHTLELSVGNSRIVRYTKTPFTPAQPKALFSMSKTFTGIAAMFAVAEGHLDIHAPLTAYFEKAPDTFRHLTPSHLLTMQTGMQYGDDLFRHTDTHDLTASIFSIPFEELSGGAFRYQSTATYLLAALLQRVTGQSVDAYLESRFFKPLGFQNYRWEHSDEGIPYGAYGLYLRLCDVTATFRFLMKKGVYNGQSLLPEKLVAQATQSQVLTGITEQGKPRSGYGWQLWIDGDGIFHGSGYYGQYGFAIPAADAVLSFTSASNDKQSIFKILWNTVMPALLSGELPAEGEEQLGDTLSFPDGINADYHLNETYSLERNALGLSDVTFSPDGLQLHTDKEHTHLLRTAYRQWLVSDLQLGDRPIPFPFDSPLLYSDVATSHAWVTKDTLHLRAAFLKTPFIQDIFFRFEGHRLTVKVKQNVGQSLSLCGERVYNRYPL